MNFPKVFSRCICHFNFFDVNFNLFKTLSKLLLFKINLISLIKSDSICVI